MFRLILFTPTRTDLTHWRLAFESDFEIIQVTNIESLIPLIRTWHPQTVVYCGSNIRRESILAISSSTHKKLGLVVVSEFYNLRDELAAFEFGADHYLLLNSPIETTKARILSLSKKIISLNRAEQTESLIQLPTHAGTYSFKDITIMVDKNLAKINNKIIKLTPTQTDLLAAFITNQNTLITRRWLQDHVFLKSKMSPRTIDAHISKLKRRIPRLRDFLLSHYGQGYVLRSELNDQNVA